MLVSTGCPSLHLPLTRSSGGSSAQAQGAQAAQAAPNIPSSPGALFRHPTSDHSRAGTFIYSARVASHLEATVSRRPVTAHAVARPAQVPFYPRRPPDPQAFESLACSAVLGRDVVALL
ncbi:hypothetical protein NDU88_010176 [Pleurodeles waltl]|uniref:Uncharacterized protein n=1 Tax=Pleurodeles waltl TaxID=8319 RepID=A0AAV7QVN1_PLEWA|nr:hypothetical protein NDU88_010176 [Pleurodeles waltl]